MKSSTDLYSPTVLVEGYDNPAPLDFVAHFLGIVTHHNDNKVRPPVVDLKLVSNFDIE